MNLPKFDEWSKEDTIVCTLIGLGVIACLALVLWANKLDKREEKIPKAEETLRKVALYGYICSKQGIKPQAMLDNLIWALTNKIEFVQTETNWQIRVNE